MTRKDLLRRLGIRLSCSALPYLAMAWLLRTYAGNDALFHGFWFWFAVVLVPGLGLAVDIFRLRAGGTAGRIS